MLNKSFFTNILYTLSSNLVTFTLNILILMILPKLISTVDYGYFQYYIVIVAFSLFLHFGWIDGIYLKYSGMSYENIDKSMISGQLIYLFLFGSLQTVVFSIILMNSSIESEKKYIYYLVSASIVFVIVKVFTYVIMQTTSRFKDYAKIMMSEKVMFLLILSIMIVSGVESFKILVLSDLIAKVFSSLYGLYLFSNIFTFQLPDWRQAIVESVNNIGAGFYILLANISSILIVSLTQLVIEKNWGIESFAEVSLSFNISKAALIVISAIGIVIFPVLKQTPVRNYNRIYLDIRNILMAILFSLLVGYYPLKIVFEIWLPDYQDSIYYLSILFPVFLFESKTSLLLNTYFKLLRYEKKLAWLNSISVLISIVLSLTAAYIIDSLSLTVFTILLVLAIRSYLLENFLARKLDLKIKFRNSLDILMVCFFITLNILATNFVSFIGYLMILSLYLGLNYREIRVALINLR